MRSLALSTLLAVLAFAPAGVAQVSQVPGTGCPGTTYPQTTGSARIGQQLGFSWSCYLPNRSAIALLGLATGGGFRFDMPFTCDPGPCVFFPGPIGGLYHTWPPQLGAGQWALAFPNDPQLVGTQWGLQCVCWCP